MIHLSAFNISRCYFLNKRKLDHTVRSILKSAGVNDARLAIVFVSDREIRRLNLMYRKRNRATDVLSFSMREGRRLKKDASFLGDIVISTDRARKQAEKFGTSFKKEMYLYIIHGVLHLLGYDDERPSSRKKMRKKETQILNRLWEKVN